MKNMNLPILFLVILATSLIQVIVSDWNTCSTWTWKPNKNTVNGKSSHAGNCNGRYCPVCSSNSTYGTGDNCISEGKTQASIQCFTYDTKAQTCIDGQSKQYTCQGFEKLMQCDATACDYN
ncbi:uncharacterized protein MELLADRAFT_58995 [Melampsora larici-populina 98AG31]|uniref:Secreted protein n=1 Tax=Melampsora larici-populina (strain 98AG31 / pathotype 3-4-7) TaxID=747676 RepID=F4R6P1_MELLP|nr:uncharacterized protein MELLADRAFT_58995 [Melampsora larici-populina 98AG31]EGG12427.1 secreted protein [Melampsora larici-populina 98AG31]